MKASFLTICVFLMISCAEKNGPLRRSPSAHWPLYRGDARLSGVAEGELPEKPQLLWTFQTGDDIKSSPVLDYGNLYVGSSDGKLYALRALTGDSLWAFDAGDDIEAAPLLLDSTVYIGSLNGIFYALDAASGVVRWSFKTDGEIYGSANWVYAPNGQDKWIIVGSYDFFIYCLDADTGEKQWSYETDNFINGAPATDGEVVVFGGCDARLHIVSIADGSSMGDVDVGSYIAGSAALADGHAFLGHYGERLVCIDLEQKRVVWEYSDNDQTGSFFSSPAVDGDRVVIGSRDKLVHCVDRKSGEKTWTFQTRDDVDSSPVLCDGKAVIGSNDGRLYMVRLSDGGLIWSFEIGADIIGSPAVTAGCIFVGAGDGRLYAFGEKL
ncbi:PQQ-binding-like beta-propeller repeat protein [candidate division KSB1 bacterium]|nr:PQQ-binding-like beta-propeller repeat protein [candidate division KSB1 bacterium]